MTNYSEIPDSAQKNLEKISRLIRSELENKYRVIGTDDHGRPRHCEIPSENEQRLARSTKLKRHELFYTGTRSVWVRRFLRANPHRKAELADRITAVRIRKTENQRHCRARKVVGTILTSAEMAEIAKLDSPRIDIRAVLAVEIPQFKEWLAINSAKARQLKRQWRDIIRARHAQLVLRNKLGRGPTHTQLACALAAWGFTSTRNAARRKMETLIFLEGPDGPWKD